MGKCEHVTEKLFYVSLFTPNLCQKKTKKVCKAHSGILGKGLALSHSPTILEALEGSLPLQVQSNEQSFLEDFIACVPGSSGGRLAR